MRAARQEAWGRGGGGAAETLLKRWGRILVRKNVSIQGRSASLLHTTSNHVKKKKMRGRKFASGRSQAEGGAGYLGSLFLKGADSA